MSAIMVDRTNTQVVIPTNEARRDPPANMDGVSHRGQIPRRCAPRNDGCCTPRNDERCAPRNDGCCTPRNDGFRRRGALLLEVVVALAILVTAIGLLSSQLVTGMNLTIYSEEQTRAAYLADEVMSRIDLDPNMGLLLSELGESDELEEEFGDRHPGYFWRITMKPVEPERQDLDVVTVEILFQRDPDDIDNIDGADIVRKLAFLRAEPAKIDLAEDAGLDDAMIEQLRAAVPIPGFDPRAVDMHQLVALDPDAMLELVPIMMTLFAQVGGGQLPGDLAGQLGGLAGAGGAGGGQEMTPEIAAQLEMLRQMAAEYEDGGGAAPAPSNRRGSGASGTTRGPGGGRGGGRASGGNRGGSGNRNPGGQSGSSGSAVDDLRQGGSGPNGDYTIEDLMRLRDEYERTQGGG